MTSTWSTAARSALGLGFGLWAPLGCGLIVGGEEVGDEGDVAGDLAEYEELAASLEADREQVLPAAAEVLATAGPWLAWREGDELELRRFGPDELEHTLALTGEVRLSASHLTRTSALGPTVVYESLALATGEFVDAHELPAGAFALAEDTLVVIEDQIGAHVIDRWQLGVEEPLALGTLEDAGLVLAQVDRLELASAELAIVVADGRLSTVELPALLGEELGSCAELFAVDGGRVLFGHDDGLYVHELGGETIRVDTAIAASGWQLNQTFATIHEYTGDGATLLGERVYYIGSAGLFAFTLDQAGPAAISPILIEPRWDVGEGIARIEYREPRLTDDGTVFVRGLLGPSGEVGETGPIFAVSPDLGP